MLIATASAGAGSVIPALLMWAVVIGLFYFMLIKPQQKETREKNAMIAELAVGDTVLTESGFYGVIIDIDAETVIIEFGSNRNCRIPMQKAKIAAIEKPEDATTEAWENDENRKKKK